MNIRERPESRMAANFESVRRLAFVKVLFVKQTTISRTTDTMSGIRVVTTSYLTISLHQWLLGM